MRPLILSLAFLSAAIIHATDTSATATLRGKLIIQEGKPPAVETADHKMVKLDGDEPTRKVLGDERLNGFLIEAKGRFTSDAGFLIDPIHTRSLLVQKDGHLKMVSYWCDVCSIRAFTPGPCVCCQKETTLDLIDPAELDK